AGGRRAPVSTGAGRPRVGRRRADGSAGGRRAVRADGRAAKGRAANGRARRADRPSTGPARANGRAPGSGARRGHFFVVVLFLRVVVRLAGAFFLTGP